MGGSRSQAMSLLGCPAGNIAGAAAALGVTTPTLLDELDVEFAWSCSTRHETTLAIRRTERIARVAHCRNAGIACAS